MRSYYGLDDDDVIEIIMNGNMEMGPGINGYVYLSPAAPAYEWHKPGITTSCDTAACDGDVKCTCLPVYTVPFNRTIQMVLSNHVLHDEGTYPDSGHHPMHLHGYDFAVLAMK